MTNVIQLPHTVDRVISATVKALYSGRRLTMDDVAVAIGVSHGTIVSRLGGRTSWTADEVARIAQYFGVKINDLYTGIDGLFDVNSPNRGSIKSGSLSSLHFWAAATEDPDEVLDVA